MRSLITFILFSISALTFGQSKDNFITNMEKDSAMLYEGEGALHVGNCVLIKYAGDAQEFFNELAKFHVQDDDQIERTKLTLNIYETNKPYWVYGRYSVFATLTPKGSYTLIEIHFKAYANPENYKMHSAHIAYQEIINSLKK